MHSVGEAFRGASEDCLHRTNYIEVVIQNHQLTTRSEGDKLGPNASGNLGSPSRIPYLETGGGGLLSSILEVINSDKTRIQSQPVLFLKQHFALAGYHLTFELCNSISSRKP